MKSIVWEGDQSVNQPWGCTPLLVEPYWAIAQCHWHCGIDIGNPGCKGQPFYAARAGRIAAIGYGYLGVLTLSGETDWYIHGEYLVVAGQAVSRGQKLGAISDRVPAGGSLFGAHLHFEVQAAGGHLNVPATSLDPVPVLSAAFSSGAGVSVKRIHGGFEIVAEIETADGAAVQFLRGMIAGGKRGLWTRRFVNGAFSSFAQIQPGGDLGVDDLGEERIVVSVDAKRNVAITVTGNDGQTYYDTISTDGCVTWSPFRNSGGSGDGLISVSAARPITVSGAGALSPAQVDQLTQIVADAHAAAAETPDIAAIRTKLDGVFK